MARPSSLRTLTLCSLFVIALCSACRGPDLPKTHEPATTLSWSDLPPLPDDFGFGGPFVGTTDGVLIVAGGANFPDGPPWAEGDKPAGGKKWHDRIFVLEPEATAWKVASTALPAPRAYGATIATDDGLLLFGGSDAGQVYDSVWLLRYDAISGVTITTVGSLPQPSAFLGAAKIKDSVFVLPGKKSKDDSDLVDALWIATVKDGGALEWNVQPGLPSGPRQKAVVAAQSTGKQPAFYVFSGEIPRRDAAGALQLDYVETSYRYTPGQDGGSWHEVASTPEPIAAGCAIDSGQAHVLCFSGSTGRHIAKPVQDRPEFPARVYAYHTVTNTWVDAGSLPQAVVTTGVTRWQDKIVLPTGEIRPGVRTNRVQQLVLGRNERPFGAANHAVLIIYLVALVGMGIYFARREKGTDDYFRAGRRVPWWAAGLSIYATQLSAITYVATPGLAFASDWMVYPAYIMILVLAPIVVTFYLPFFRRLNLTSAYEYLERRFNYAVRLFGCLSFITFQILRMAIVVYLPALALSTITGLDVITCILIMGVLATVYTVLGGIEAVIWTDVLQAGVLLGGVIVALVLICTDEGLGRVFTVAMENEKTRLFDWNWSFTDMVSWGVLIGALALNFGPYTTDQAVIQRYLSTKDEKAAARGIWLNGLAALPLGLVFFVLGAGLFVYFQSHPELLPIGMKNDEVFPLFVSARLPVGLSGLVIAGIFAASMSSLDSSMHSIATSFTSDIYRRVAPDRQDHHYLNVARTVTIAMGVVGIGTAIMLSTSDIRSQFLFFQKALGLLSSGLVGVFMLGVFTRRAHAAGVLLGVAASVAALVWLNWFTNVNFYWHAVVGTSTCVVVGYGASVLLPSPARELDGLTYRTLARERASE